MPRLTTRDYKRTSRSSSAWRLREFALGVLVGIVLASAAFLIAGAHARHRAAAAAHSAGAARSRDAAPPAPAPDDGAANDPGAARATADPDAAHPTSAHAAVQSPQYDFYRMLPRLNVPVPHDDERPSHAPPAAATAPPHATQSGPSYLLQVGSYRSTAEADQLRARLARAGIAAQVVRSAQGSQTWNRVRIGPLSDAQLARVRAQLRTANLHALVIRDR